MSRPPNSNSNSNKQATLFGYFNKKPAGGEPSSSSSPAAGPSRSASATANANGSSSNGKPKSSDGASTSKINGSKKGPASAAETPSASRPSARTPLSESETIDLSSEGLDGDEADNNIPEASTTKTPLNASTSQRSSAKSGPSASSLKDKATNGTSKSRTASASESEGGHDGDGDASMSAGEGLSGVSGSEMDLDDAGDEEEEEEGSRPKRKASQSRANKRQIVLSDDENEDEDDAGSAFDDAGSSASGSAPPKKKSKGAGSGQAKSNKRAKSESPLMLSSEDDEEDFDDDAVDWDAAAELSDASGGNRAGKASKGKGRAAPVAKKGNASSAETGKSKAVQKKLPGGRPAAKSQGSTDSFKTVADLERAKRQKAYIEEGGETFDFLREDVIMDASKKRPDDPDYDKRTLYIPKKAEGSFTPFEQQFWDIKRNHMDTVLFFQKGKFFELYEQDADIGSQVFDLKLTGRVKMRMVGVPEASIDFWVAKFLGQGYKVGRVEQAETALGADLRRKDEKGSKTSKAKAGPNIVNRELKTVLTTGTVVDGELMTDDLSVHCIAIKESFVEGNTNPTFGIVVADCSTAEFQLCTFQDDACRTQLETIIRQHRPRDLVCERGNLSGPTTRLLRAAAGLACEWTPLKPGTEFPSAKDALGQIRDLFNSKDDDENAGMDLDGQGDERVPQQIKDLYGSAETMSALGGMLYYLRGLNLDKDLLTVNNFNIFDPIRDGQSLILDGQTLAHIEILQNSDGTDEGTLFKLLCRCSTPFGKRLFKIWVCQPLRKAKDINARLDAVEDIMDAPAFLKAFDEECKRMPDLERLLSRIHAGSCRIKDFLKVLDTFEKLGLLNEKLVHATKDFKSKTLPALLRSSPDLTSIVADLRQMFTPKDDELTPTKGVDPEYDATREAVAQVEEELDELLKGYRKIYKDKSIEYRDIGTKDIFQIQCPIKLKVPKNWTKVSGTQQVTRYYSPEVLALVKQLKEVRERRDQASKVFQFKVYEKFSEDYATWLKAVKLVAEIDCLVSLARSSMALGEPAVRPEIVEGTEAFVEFEELRHPCVFSASVDFIPNDVRLGGSSDERKMVLLTGPNMAGKSTLLRMSCVGLIMAQLGCYVPAKSARISPCDRIVSRMGAADNMLAGQSTFRVEMEDCRKILVEATPKTLVILDELGRGTSTHDGLSIAYAVLHQLAGHLGCIGFFATHFTSLVDDYAAHPQIALKHMKTFVDEESREVTFLYRLADGCSPKSYGPHVASMAGVPRDIVERAIGVSKEFEDRTRAHEASKRKDQVAPLDHQANVSYLLKLASQDAVPFSQQLVPVLRLIRSKIRCAKDEKIEQMKE